MAEIIKIDNDTYKIIDTTEEIVSLSELERQLEFLTQQNIIYTDLHNQSLSIPESLRAYINIPYYYNTHDLEEQINKLKSL